MFLWPKVLHKILPVAWW